MTFFLILQYVGNAKKVALKLFENVSKRKLLRQNFFRSAATVQQAKRLELVTKSVQMELFILI